MIAEAIEKIIEIAKPNIHTSDGGCTYSDKKLFPVDNFNHCEPISTTTLSSIVEYAREFMKVDGFDPEKIMVHIESHDRVSVLDMLDSDAKRDRIMIAKATGPHFSFGTFMDNEQFLIMVQSLFVDDPETQKADVLKFAGTVTSGTIKEYGDDGITQRATIKVGITEKRSGVVPSPCRLRPYRTFTEVTQPASEFVFRMKESGNGVQCALFEADGGAWKTEAMMHIKKYLIDQLNDTGITVIM